MDFTEVSVHAQRSELQRQLRDAQLGAEVSALRKRERHVRRVHWHKLRGALARVMAALTRVANSDGAPAVGALRHSRRVT